MEILCFGPVNLCIFSCYVPIVLMLIAFSVLLLKILVAIATRLFNYWLDTETLTSVDFKAVIPHAFRFLNSLWVLTLRVHASYSALVALFNF